MTLTLTLADGQARRLQTLAAARGLSVEDYLLDLAAREPLPYDAWRERLHALPALAPRAVPALPDEALDRATMYRD